MNPCLFYTLWFITTSNLGSVSENKKIEYTGFIFLGHPLRSKCLLNRGLVFFHCFCSIFELHGFIHCLSFTQYWTLVLIRMHFFLTRNCQGLYWVFHKELFHCSTWKHRNFFSPRVNSWECLANVLKKICSFQKIFPRFPFLKWKNLVGYHSIYTTSYLVIFT